MNKTVEGPWTYTEEPEGERSEYIIRTRGRVIGRVSTKGDADMICRSRRDAAREAMQLAFETRRHRLHIMRLHGEIRELVSGLDRVSGALKAQAKERERTAAREEIAKLLRNMKSKGYTR